ncbi:E3 SUMO-protein ligase pli1 [Neonectria punicea]|uniref:E3 SUMO-protein ligase pli1 n=1 Tax=Neonectria punicea TaxID=979145 RepID=A0ABR1GMS5_9HYPO
MASTSGLGSAAAPASSVSRLEASQLVRQVNRLLNRQLSLVCQVNGVKSTGIKAELQNRIANLIEEAVITQDPVRFHQIRQSVQNVVANVPTAGGSPARASHSHTHSPHPPLAHALQTSMAFANNFSRDGNAARPSHRAVSASRPSVSFKQSPFYKIEAALSDVRVCDAMSQHRNSVTVPLKLNDHPALQKCVNDKSYRVMVFCAGDNTGMQDIAFPHQSELRINSGDIKANLRGLKNKPGSTRPVDITSALRLKHNYTNNLEFTYALTNKAGGRHKFFLVVNLCRVTTVEELATRISDGKRIPIQSVLQEFSEKAQDSDVVATSQVLSLKCPLSYMRLDLPCRSLSCAHIQCFDATSYLQLQEQGPQWLCPICNKSAPFEQLAVDDYVKEILSKTPKSLETVTIEPNGKWHIKTNDDEREKHFGSQGQHSQFHNDDEDDDDLEISEVNIIGRRLETPKNTASSTGTPVSAGPRGIASTSNKRPAPAVIDLTLSSDDEDDDIVQRPTKRQHTGTNGFHSSPDNVDFLHESPGYPS